MSYVEVFTSVDEQNRILIERMRQAEKNVERARQEFMQANRALEMFLHQYPKARRG